MPDIKAQNETALASVKAIYDAADEANTLLDGMQTAATQAGTTLTQIYSDATSAKASAENASEYAARALGNLASVQSVTETLAWITAHGTMTLTSDTALDPSHVYFVVDANGDYTVGGTHYSVVSEPVLADIGTYYELSINESLNNYVATHLVVDSEGLWIIPDSGGNKVLIATGSGSTYTTAGTYIIGKVNNVDTVLASFTASGATIGRDASGQSRTIISADGMQIYRKVSNSDTQLVNLGYGLGNNASGGQSYAPYTTLGERDSGSAVGNYSVAEGHGNVSSGYCSHAEGNNTTASEQTAHSEGLWTTASGDYGAHAEGYYSIASGDYGAHAEGDSSTASGWASHSEGRSATASGSYSHAQNLGTIASKYGQTAIGTYNVEDTGTANTGDYVLIIGKGSADNHRSNAFAFTWDGDIEMALETDIASGVDKEIYDALVSLGWDSDCIV